MQIRMRFVCQWSTSWDTLLSPSLETGLACGMLIDALWRLVDCLPLRDLQTLHPLSSPPLLHFLTFLCSCLAWLWSYRWLIYLLTALDIIAAIVTVFRAVQSRTVGRRSAEEICKLSLVRLRPTTTSHRNSIASVARSARGEISIWTVVRADWWFVIVGDAEKSPIMSILNKRYFFFFYFFFFGLNLFSFFSVRRVGATHNAAPICIGNHSPYSIHQTDAPSILSFSSDGIWSIFNAAIGGAWNSV